MPSPKSQTRDWNTLPASKVLVSVKVQSSEVQLEVKLACGAAGTGGAVTVTGRTTVPVARATSATPSVTL